MVSQNVNNSFISSSRRVLKNKVQWLQQATGSWDSWIYFLSLTYITPYVSPSILQCPQYFFNASDVVGLNLLMPCRCTLLGIGRNHLRFKDEVIFPLGAWLPKQSLLWLTPKKMQLPLKFPISSLTPGIIFPCEVILLIEYLLPTPQHECSFWVRSVNCLSHAHKVESKLQLSQLLSYFPLQASILSHIQRLRAISEVLMRCALYSALPYRLDADSWFLDKGIKTLLGNSGTCTRRCWWCTQSMHSWVSCLGEASAATRWA